MGLSLILVELKVCVTRPICLGGESRPKALVQAGDKLRVKVISWDPEADKLGLSHKEFAEDLWAEKIGGFRGRRSGSWKSRQPGQVWCLC